MIPFNSHARVVDGSEASLEVGQRVFGQKQVLQILEELWRLVNVITDVISSSEASKAFKIGDLVNGSLHSFGQLGI